MSTAEITDILDNGNIIFFPEVFLNSEENNMLHWVTTESQKKLCGRCVGCGRTLDMEGQINASVGK